MSDPREQAYANLAVPNTSPMLEPVQVGYIELVSSPDRRVEPMIFALEHTKVRLGRFSTAGTYATSPDVYVAVSEQAIAITPMNTMFEFLDDSFHAFDTRSANGTFVNGKQIRKRQRLAPGDVIDIGGAPEVGGARVVFLGQTAPAGRLVQRAPARTRFTWSSPRRGVTLEIDAAGATATATANLEDPEWREAALDAAREVYKLRSPRLPPSAIGGPAPNVIEYRFEGPVVEIHETRPLSVAHASAIVASLCEAVAACHAAKPRPILVGPFERRLVWPRARGGAVLLGAGISRIGFLHDAAVRGAMMTPRHFRRSPEELGRDTTGPATDVFFLAYFWCELVFGREPYPVGDEMRYLQAVMNGRPELPDVAPVAITAAFSPDRAKRPALDALAATLRALAER
jgi:hypothetical protein